MMDARDREVARQTVRPRSECHHCNPGASPSSEVGNRKPDHATVYVARSLDHAGEFLITLWGDGTGEFAWRPDPAATWGPPTRLEPAP